MRVCRTRVAVRGRRRKERVLIPRYRFVSVALEFAAVGAGFEIMGPGSRAVVLGQALPWGWGRDCSCRCSAQPAAPSGAGLRPAKHVSTHWKSGNESGV